MSRPLNLLLSRGGGQGRDVLDAVLAAGERQVCLFDLDDGAGEFEMGTLQPVSTLTVAEGEDYIFASRRDARVQALIDQHFKDVALARVVHPRASVSPFATLGQNTFVGAMAVVNPQARVGDFVFINAGCIIDHDCVIGDGTSLGPGCSFPGFVTIGENCAIGAGVVAKPGVRIIAGCTLGAGAVVVKDLEAPGVYVGNPARLLK